MPSKTLKHQSFPSLWKAVSDCAESELVAIASSLAQELRPGDRVLLEGPMGVGKTTFVRPLLSSLGVHQPPEGSPSFAIAHEYDSPKGGIVHIDYYRLKHESEIDDAGLPSYYWERKLIVISEWLSSWPEFEKQVMESGPIWRIELSFCESSSENDIENSQIESQAKLQTKLMKRNIKIEKFNYSS